MSVDIVDKNSCCGCGACGQICPYRAIEMVYNVEGFYAPQINTKKCVECGLCERVCSCINKLDKNCIMYVYGAKHINSQIQSTSQSGGAFMGIAELIIEDNGVVYGAAIGDDFITKHIRIVDKEKLKELQGTKYVQSKLENTYKNIASDLNDGKKVMFSGLPCQAAGLKQYISKLKIATNNLYICELLCYGVPSPKVFSDWLICIQKSYKDNLRYISFRDRKKDWGKGKEKYEFVSGQSVESSLYTSLYFGHLIDRQSCHNCKFRGIERVGDITIGDFWGIEEVDEDFYDKRGVSVILINTEKGNKVYKRLSDKMIMKEYTIDNVISKQPSLYKHKIVAKDREKFWREYKLFGIKYIAQEKGELKIDLSYKILYRLNNLYNKLINKR